MGTKRQKHNSLIMALSRELEGLLRLCEPMREAVMARRLDEIAAVTTGLAHAQATDLAEVEVKLRILCRRLREFVDPDNIGAVLTILLAESIRDDVQLLAWNPPRGRSRRDRR
jgi:hypothetical protein